MSKIIFLNGTSSSGKSTLAKQIQAQATIPFWHFASDQLVEVGMLPKRENNGGVFDWKFNRPKFFAAFHACIKSILDTGNNIILDHIIESDDWYDELKVILADHDLFFVGVHCPVSILRERELARGDRHIGNRYSGEAEYHLTHVHGYSEYDFELDTSTQAPIESAKIVLDAWSARRSSRFFANRNLVG
ncbi:chloramphenicol phosphotransferase CPT family protein [Vibrio tubiashii]|uniref:chloramphenicol phosphotransferase CPT family protein n=1 Tax=Vibrio tubiashii TaxID=29498 RepID=UPI001EFE7A79|nr:chloramphenicol phosphotransferase CPT family protein [Vibrio tubiashii]MCG9576289.1 chloramphenicol phosphotransferase CPT family protein [Vibrio tubiashii]